MLTEYMTRHIDHPYLQTLGDFSMISEDINLHMFKIQGLAEFGGIIDLGSMIIVACDLAPAKAEAARRMPSLAARHPGLRGVRIFDAEGRPHDVHVSAESQVHDLPCSVAR
jgi:hypothetical protein